MYFNTTESDLSELDKRTNKTKKKYINKFFKNTFLAQTFQFKTLFFSQNCNIKKYFTRGIIKIIFY